MIFLVKSLLNGLKKLVYPLKKWLNHWEILLWYNFMNVKENSMKKLSAVDSTTSFWEPVWSFSNINKEFMKNEQSR